MIGKEEKTHSAGVQGDDKVVHVMRFCPLTDTSISALIGSSKPDQICFEEELITCVVAGVAHLISIILTSVRIYNIWKGTAPQYCQKGGALFVQFLAITVSLVCLLIPLIQFGARLEEWAAVPLSPGGKLGPYEWPGEHVCCRARRADAVLSSSGQVHIRCFQYCSKNVVLSNQPRPSGQHTFV